MFSKKPHLDVKKSSQKVLDCKKDSLSRLKHLKIVLENLDTAEAKTFFENNSSHIYYIFYDVFINVENNIRQRAHHRTHREELDVVKYILEKILLLLPELLHKRWQCHSLGRIMKKFLHYGNSTKLRREGIRLFLLWYQILGDNAPDELDTMFTTLVPGIIPGVPNLYLAVQNTNQGHGFFSRGQNASVDAYSETSTFYASSAETADSGPIYPSEIFPIVPIAATEQQPEDHTVYFLDCLLELMVSQVCRVEWQDKSEFKAQRCFQFLFEKFKKYYLPHLFPNFSDATNLYIPVLDLPQLRCESDIKFIHESNRFAQKDTLQHCQAIFVRWVTHFTQCLKKSSVTFQPPVVNETVEQTDTNRPTTTDVDSNQTATNFVTAAPVGLDRDPSSTSLSNDELSYRDYIIVRDTLYSSRININFVHEIFRQAFLMHFTYSSTMRKVVAVYREWIQKNNTERPIFLEEPAVKPETDFKEEKVPEESTNSVNNSVKECFDLYDITSEEQMHLRLRKDSYLKAIHCDRGHLKAGTQNMLNVFITNAANVFLLDLSTDNLQLLEEQVDMCKRVLNIYRYMVMNAHMERRVWEQLLLVLLQITSLVLKEVPPARKEDTLGGRLAPALFQTLIVTWIKANLNVVISTDLWDQFLNVLSSLTQWEELIKEWAKTMETLTRVLAKQVYCLDLNDLPLDRLSEQKMKKTRGIKKLSMGALEDKNNLKNAHKNKSTFHTNTDYEDSSSQDTETERGSGQPTMRSRSGSGSSHKHGVHMEQNLHRSFSDSNLYKRRHSRRVTKEMISLSHKQALIVTGASPCADEELSHIIPSFEDENDEHHPSKRGYSRQKSKSLDFLSHRAESPCFSESSECHSRSPSPTPSSGLESTSIKDSPMQIDVLASNTENACCNAELNNSSNIEAQSIMSGGSTRGWLPDVAVVLWKRMLGALGDINLITDANIHAQVLKYLVDLSELLIKIRDNLGVTTDNLTSPPPPELVPPFLIITPWLFKAIMLPDKYKEGKLLAYKLLCLLTLCRHDISLSHDYLVQFYRVLHYGLICEDQDVVNVIVRSCPKFFATNLPGCTLLLMDFIYATDTIVSSSGLKGVPRTEAISILGTLLCLPNVYKEIPTLKTSSKELCIVNSKDAKDHITSILFKAGKREPAGLARCIAINSIGIYLYEELKNATNHFRIKEAVTVLLIAVRSSVSASSLNPWRKKFTSKAVAQVATDILLLLCDHAHYLLKNYVDLVRKIIEVLSSTLGHLLPNPDVPVGEEDKKLMLSLIYCLGEWCMHLKQSFLTEVRSPLLSDESHSPLFSVFKVLHAAATGSRNTGNSSVKTMMELGGGDVDPTILLDNLQEGTTSPSVYDAAGDRIKRADESSFFRTFMDPQQNHDVIKLAAKNVVSHLVNHLGHFPMGVGAVRLTSLVNEYDDVPSLTGDELSAEVFHAPNIQFFVVNNASVVSLVEIPSLEMPGGGAAAGLTTSKSQVRVIVRDLSGKFSWDCSILYGPPDYCERSSLVPETNIPVLCVNNLLVSPSRTSNFPVTECSPSDIILGPRTITVLPTVENSTDGFDNLDNLLQYIGSMSPECISNPGQALNAPLKMPNEQDQEKEVDVMNLTINQHNLESNQISKYSQSTSMDAKKIKPSQPCEDSFPFQHCRLLLNQLGFTLWEKRPTCDLLKKNEQLLRELRNLDKQKCRETHKIAVIYVAKGQEDKTSILSNYGGSQEFEEFVAGLGWEVELENHLGFLGGLQRNKSTGDTAPYYATSFVEVIFHVSTRMSISQDKDAINKKVRHLGNDEVHIVWSEHTRDYRKEIIATEFCDVLIVIYPIGGRMYRIHISRKSGVPFFGPLFSGAVVEHKILASLVRATAINANRAKRSLVSLYMNFYEERAKSLEVIVQNHKDKTTFEQFAASIYSPAPPKSYAPSRSSGPPSRTDSACSRGLHNLAAALLDAHSKGSAYSPSLRSRPVSQSTSEGISPHSSPQTSLRDRPLSASHTQS